MNSKSEIRAPGRPTFTRTGRRGRPRKLFRTRTLSAGETLTDNYNAQPDEQSDENFAGVDEVSIQRAINGPDNEEWLNAIESEVVSLIKNNTWEIVKSCDEENVIGCRFVLTNKCGLDGTVEKRKARLVAKAIVKSRVLIMIRLLHRWLGWKL